MAGLSKAQGALQSFGGQVRGFSAGLQAQFSGLQGVAVGLGASVLGLGSAAVQAAADYESLNIAFTAMMGSAEAAKAHIEDLTNLAAKTPFQFGDLARASQAFQ